MYSGVRSEKLTIGGSKPTGKVADVLQLVRPKVPTDDDIAWSFPHDTDNGDSDSTGKSARSPAKKKVRPLLLCILETPQWICYQTVKTLMKCRNMRHFIRVYTAW